MPSMSVTRVFQEFLLNMEDNVDETESVKRYNQYKLDFRRQQLQDFFLQHKEQEWFRSKYHPDDITARRAETLAALKMRLRVFLFLLENNWLDNMSLDMEHAPPIIKLMDAGKEHSQGCSWGRGMGISWFNISISGFQISCLFPLRILFGTCSPVPPFNRGGL